MDDNRFDSDDIKERDPRYSQEREDGHKESSEKDDRFANEKEWADALGMDFDEERAMKAQNPVPPAIPENLGRSQLPPAPEFRQPAAPRPNPTPTPSTPPAFRPPMPPTFMFWAILSTLCCCFPAGLVALFFSMSVSSRYYAGDYEQAARNSRNTEIWIIISIVAGIVFGALYMPLMMLF